MSFESKNDNSVDIDRLKSSSALQPTSYGQRVMSNAVGYGLIGAVVGLGCSWLLAKGPAERTAGMAGDIIQWALLGGLVGYVEAQSSNNKITEVKQALDAQVARQKGCDR